MNKVILVGEVAYPPRYNETNYGAVLNIMVRTKHRYKNNSGEIVEKAQQTRAALWGKLAELYRGVRKDDLVSLEGRLQNKKVQDKTGAETWQTEVVCNAFEVLLGADMDDYGEPSDKAAPEEAPVDDFTDDDIPF